MRLETLEFLKTGSWDGPFTAQLGRYVTLVLGDNEAGKSTTRRALDALFFAPDLARVAPQTLGTFHFAATVDPGDGTRFRLARRGKNHALPLPAWLQKRLAPENAGKFRDLFGLSHENLRAASDGLLDTHGSIGGLLFGARTGLAPDVLSRLIEKLDKRIGEAASRGQKSSGLGVGLKQYDDAKTRRANITGFQQFDEAIDTRDRAAETVRELERALDQLRDEEKRLKSLLDGLPTLEGLQAARDKLAALRSPPSREQATKLQHARQALSEATDQRDSRQRDDELAAKTLERTPEAGPVVALVEDVEGLVAEVGAIDGLRETLQNELEQREKRSRELTILIESLGGDATGDLVATAARLIRPAAVREVLHELVTRRTKVANARAASQDTRLGAELRLTEARRSAAAAPTFDTEPLERAKPYADEAAAAEKRVAELTEALKTLDAQVEEDARELGLVQRPDAGTEPHHRPDPKRTRALEKRLEETAAEVTTRTKELATATRKRQSVEKTCRDLQAQLGDVPTDEKVSRTKALRDSKWQELKAVWTPTLRAGTDVQQLAAEFETFLHLVDDLVSRRALAGEASGRLQAEESALAAATLDVSVATKARDAAEQEHQAVVAEWTALWSFVVQPPESAKDWFTLQARWDKARSDRRDTSTELAETRTRLDQALANVRAHAGEAHPTLRSLVTADAVLKELAAEEKRRHAANKAASARHGEVSGAEKFLRETDATLTRLAQDEAAWTAEWQSRRSDVPEGITLDPTLVEVWLGKQADLERNRRELLEHTDRTVTLRARIATHDDALATILDRARTLDPALGLPTTLSPRDGFRALVEHTSRARKLRDERTKALELRTGTTRELVLAAQRHDERRRALDDLWHTLGHAEPWTDTALDTAQALAEEASGLQAEVERLDNLLDCRWGTARVAFLERLDTQGRAGLEGAAQAIALRLHEATTQLATARDALHAAEAVRRQLEATHDAVAIEQSFQEARDAVLDRADELLRLQLARHLLVEARTRASEGASDLAARASRHFATLTGQAFSGLRFEHEAPGQASLHALTASGDEKEVHELSAGTADQLWLALRLAAIEQAAKETPFPLLLDDVFIQFDDARTTAALKLLAEISEHVQVILFTHHDHLLDLARAAIPDRLAEVTLPRPDGSARVRTLATGRTPHARPALPEPEGNAEDEETEPATARTRRPRGETSGAETLVLELLAAAPEPLGKTDLLAAALSRGEELETRWTATIKALVDSGQVLQEGQKRGARYRLASP